MAKIREIIEKVDELRPNAFTETQKTQWLAALDGRIALEVMLMSVDDAQYLQYRYPEDLETELLLRFPHTDIYIHWLCAQIDYSNGEYDRYQNDMEMYNASVESFVCWFAGYYDPAQGYTRGDEYA